MTNSPVIKRGFVPDICRLLCLFELQQILNGYTSVQHLPSKCQWKKQVKSAVLSRSMLLWRQRLYNDNVFLRFRKLHTSVAQAIVWKMSHSGCDLKLCDFIARLWASTPDSGTYICSHCNCQYRDALTHLIAECGCSLNLRESFLHDCIDILPPELLNGLIASDGDTFVAAVLSASCWSNLDTEVTEMFLRHAYTFIRNCCRRTCVHS